jgi:hypothetical protein
MSTWHSAELNEHKDNSYPPPNSVSPNKFTLLTITPQYNQDKNRQNLHREQNGEERQKKNRIKTPQENNQK